MKTPDKNALEWTVFGLSLVLIAAVIATLVHAEITRPDTPPDLSVRLLESRRSGSQFVVGIEVMNAGGDTAANAVVEVRLTTDGETEHGEITFPFVPPGAVRNGEVVFARDPGSGTLEARVVGYERP